MFVRAVVVLLLLMRCSERSRDGNSGGWRRRRRNTVSTNNATFLLLLLLLLIVKQARHRVRTGRAVVARRRGGVGRCDWDRQLVDVERVTIVVGAAGGDVIVAGGNAKEVRGIHEEGEVRRPVRANLLLLLLCGINTSSSATKTKRAAIALRWKGRGGGGPSGRVRRCCAECIRAVDAVPRPTLISCGGGEVAVTRH